MNYRASRLIRHRAIAVAHFAGFASLFAMVVPGVPLRSTPGFMLTSAPRTDKLQV
jgi:hypothetical protein